jgi:hypothetical protein
MLLFDYLYLDDAQVQRHLSALSGGTVGPTAVSSSSQSQRGGGLSGGVGPVAAKVDRSSSATGNSSFTIEPTPEARFQQLLGLVRSSNGWQVLDPMDDRAWDEVERGMTIEVHATLSLPAQIAALMAASAAAPLAKAFGALGNWMPQGSVDPATLQQMNLVAQASQGIQTVRDQLEGKALPFMATPTNGTNQRFVVNLKQQAMRVQLDELTDGPVTVTARVTQRGRTKQAMVAGHDFDVSKSESGGRRQSRPTSQGHPTGCDGTQAHHSQVPWRTARSLGHHPLRTVAQRPDVGRRQGCGFSSEADGLGGSHLTIVRRVELVVGRFLSLSSSER